MSDLRIDALRRSLDGVFASLLATCDADGVPNVSMISQVHYVDPERVALSYQFFNKTRRNLLATGRAAVQITDPETLEHHRLDPEFEETQSNGPVFESMKAKLAGIASHHGMEQVFRLFGADIFRIRGIEAVPGPVSPRRPERASLLAATRRTCAALDACGDLGDILDCVTEALAREFDIQHSMVLMAETGAETLHRLIREHLATGRTEITTRELRLDPTLRLPSHAENLDARLVLLRKRLEERDACLRIERAGRGRFRLLASCHLSLEEVGDQYQPVWQEFSIREYSLPDLR